jgi:hypothetical protein
MVLLTLSIIVPNVSFSHKVQLYDIPAINKNHVFSVYGSNSVKSLSNLNISQPDGVVVGDVSFTSSGVKVTGNTNSIRYRGITPSPQGCTMMVMYKTGSTVGDAGMVSLWGESLLSADTLNRRILGLTVSSQAVYSSNPGATDSATLRPQVGGTEYLLSMTRAVKGTPSVLRRHNPDGSVAFASPINENTATALTYASDAVFDVGMASMASQTGVFIKGAALWTGAMTDEDITAAAALMYSITHTQ